jgi:hypothetical protein
MKTKSFTIALVMGALLVSLTSFSQSSISNGAIEKIKMTQPNTVIHEEGKNIGSTPILKTQIILANSIKMTLDEKHAKHVANLPKAKNGSTPVMISNIEK